VDDPPPLDFRPLEVDQKTNRPTRGAQIVETLRGVFASKAFYTFQLDHENVLDQDVSEVFSDRVALVGDCKGSLGDSPNAPKAEFSE
jgi:hypothetical protein